MILVEFKAQSLALVKLFIILIFFHQICLWTRIAPHRKGTTSYQYPCYNISNRTRTEHFYIVIVYSTSQHHTLTVLNTVLKAVLKTIVNTVH